MTTVKQALIKVKLLEVKKMGQGIPDRLYLLKPEVSEKDIYLINKAETLEALETGKNCTSKEAKIAPLEKQKLLPINTNNIKTENNEIKDFVNNDSLTEIQILDFINSLYTKYSIGRWNKAQWKSLTEKLANEIYINPEFHKKASPHAYITACLNGITHKHDIKYGKKEFEVNTGNEGSVPFYNWLEV
jgi:hypothetical protein